MDETLGQYLLLCLWLCLPWLIAAFAMLSRLGNPSYAENWHRTKQEVSAVYLFFGVGGSIAAVLETEEGMWGFAPLAFLIGLGVLRTVTTSRRLLNLWITLSLVSLGGAALASVAF